MRKDDDPASETAGSSDRRVDAKTLWSGGAATAVVAGLIALAGIPIPRPIGGGYQPNYPRSTPGT